MESEIFEVLIGEEEIASRISELADIIDDDYMGEEIIVVPVLKGGMLLASSLMLEIKKSPIIIDYVDVSSYGDKTESSGDIKPNKWLVNSVTGKNVLIVDDIIDSGRTLNYVKNRIASENPKSVKICTLLDKPSRRDHKINICSDYNGFNIEDVFVAGYGLDYKQHERNRPYIVKVKRHQ